jgi:putative nucleotidyltransferase with HDIG domain
VFHDSEGGEEAFSRTNLWIHSATVAILCEMIAKRIFGLEGEDYFLAGIIHDIGLVAEDQVAGDLLRKACAEYTPGEKSMIEYEREVIGTDHCRVGGALAREWGLPDEVLKAVRFHHDKERDFQPESATGIVQLAEYFSGKMKYSVIKGQVESLSPGLVEHVKQKLDNYKVLVKDLPNEMAKAKELYEQPESK